MKKELKYITIDNINAHARPGAVVSNCIFEALQLASKEGVNVILKHNDLEYTIDFAHHMEIVLETMKADKFKK